MRNIRWRSLGNCSCHPNNLVVPRFLHRSCEMYSLISKFSTGNRSRFCPVFATWLDSTWFSNRQSPELFWPWSLFDGPVGNILSVPPESKISSFSDSCRTTALIMMKWWKVNLPFSFITSGDCSEWSSSLHIQYCWYPSMFQSCNSLLGLWPVHPSNRNTC